MSLLARRISLMVLALGVAGAGLLPLACVRSRPAPVVNPATPIIRVRLEREAGKLTLTALQQPTISTTSNPAPRRLNVPPGANVVIKRLGANWLIGDVQIAGGEMTIVPAQDDTLRVDGRRYRGRFRLVPGDGPEKFDLVNDVDIESYLKGVLAAEMWPNWHEEAFEAQAIVARTYALYEAKTAGAKRHYDVADDTSSQVYKGISDETARSRLAVEQTAGVVCVYGAPGRERIFKTYFSACCGGITQSAADAFGEAYLEPLSDQNVKALCASPDNSKFNWGPIVVSKEELTQRFRAYGTRRQSPEAKMAMVSQIDVQWRNRWGRPTSFVVTDVNGNRFSMTGEELRWAVNTNAPGTLISSFVKTVDDPAARTITFLDGHGNGHGVGMCQWCAQIRASAGMCHEDIVLSSFQRARLARAY